MHRSCAKVMSPLPFKMRPDCVRSELMTSDRNGGGTTRFEQSGCCGTKSALHGQYIWSNRADEDLDSVLTKAGRLFWSHDYGSDHHDPELCCYPASYLIAYSKVYVGPHPADPDRGSLSE